MTGRGDIVLRVWCSLKVGPWGVRKKTQGLNLGLSQKQFHTGPFLYSVTEGWQEGAGIRYSRLSTPVLARREHPSIKYFWPSMTWGVKDFSRKKPVKHLVLPCDLYAFWVSISSFYRIVGIIKWEKSSSKHGVIQSYECIQWAFSTAVPATANFSYIDHKLTYGIRAMSSFSFISVSVYAHKRLNFAHLSLILWRLRQWG